jgi:hypothetical protein
MSCGEEGFAEVARDDLFRGADGREVDASIPAEEHIDVRRYTMELGEGEDSGFLSAFRRFGMTKASGGGQKGFEQLGDAGLMH